MSELLNSLNVPSETPPQSWASEVAAAAAEPAPSVPESVSTEPAPEPVAAAEPAVEAPQEQETASEEPDRRVPLKALQEERQKRAQYEQQLQEYQRREQEWQAWAAQQQAAQQAQQQPQEQWVEPDPETDPIGALKLANERLQNIQREAQERQYVEQLNTVAYQAATQFQQQVPDYQDAYRYALNSRAQELVALGTNPQMVPQILQQEELRLIDTALQNRKNPAEAIYHFAKARGFQGKAAPAVEAAPAPAAVPDPVLQETKRQVAASASAGGAPASKGNLSVSDIANLNGAAFDAAWNKMFSGNKSSVFRE